MWRRYGFFSRDAAEAPAALGASPVGAADVGRGAVAVAAAHGVVAVLRPAEPEGAAGGADTAARVFAAHSQALFAVAGSGRGTLATAGADADGGGAALKLWKALSFPPDPTAPPPLLRSAKLFPSSRFPEADVAALAVAGGAEAGSAAVAAAGLASGDVYVLRGEHGRERVTRSRLAAGVGPVAAVEVSADGGTVYVVGAEASAAFVGLGDKDGPRRVALDAFGSPGRCVALTERDELVVGREEAVYFYDPDGRGPCLAFAGEKRDLATFKGHLAVVAANPAPAPGATSQLTVYDLRHKLIAFQAPVGDVAQLVCAAGVVVVLLADGAAFALREKPVAEKLELLFRKNLYGVAINLIEAESGDPRTVAEVQRRYGDHLYGKQDFDGAMAQYLQTVGVVEPSYVIRQFLDARRIHNLTTYLEALHVGGFATADHTTLLLNCYTKLKDVPKLDNFLLGSGREGEDESPEAYRARFDVETVIRVCRAAGYAEHALQVATRAGDHSMRLSCLLEDLDRYDDALAFIETLPADEADEAIRVYGRALVARQPEETAALMRRLAAPGEPNSLRRAVSTIHVFAERPRALLDFLGYVEEGLRDAGPGADERPGAAERTVYNTLLELLLRHSLGDGAEEPEQRRLERRARALELLKSAWPAGGTARYDTDHALVLCQMHSFRPGAILLYERMKQFDEVLRCYMDAGDSRGLLDTAVRLGRHEPALWLEVLSHLARRPGDVTREVREALGHIEGNRLIPPLIVLQTLAQNPGLPLSVVKDYVARAIGAESRLIDEDRAAIAQYAEETKRMRDELRDLRTTARIFQNNRCAVCTTQLELPTVHFLCMHSYHARCLGDSEVECPKCAPEARTVFEIKRSLESAAGDADKFFQALRHSDDGFAVVAEHFGRGVLRGPGAS